MENIVEGFCDSRGYKSVPKKLKGTTKLTGERLQNFMKFVKKNRNKRKSTLSFEVSLENVFY